MPGMPVHNTLVNHATPQLLGYTLQLALCSHHTPAQVKYALHFSIKHAMTPTLVCQAHHTLVTAPVAFDAPTQSQGTDSVRTQHSSYHCKLGGRHLCLHLGREEQATREATAAAAATSAACHHTANTRRCCDYHL
jgi:hypothetical protein